MIAELRVAAIDDARTPVVVTAVTVVLAPGELIVRADPTAATVRVPSAVELRSVADIRAMARVRAGSDRVPIGRPASVADIRVMASV
ncbi:subtilisin inhibitor-like protein 8 domain protein, partial [Leifsonia aquatica ATCC 14665]